TFHIITCISTRPPSSTLFPYTTLFRSRAAPSRVVSRCREPRAGAAHARALHQHRHERSGSQRAQGRSAAPAHGTRHGRVRRRDPDRKSTRLNSSHVKISYAVFCLKKKK